MTYTPQKSKDSRIVRLEPYMVNYLNSVKYQTGISVQKQIEEAIIRQILRDPRADSVVKKQAQKELDLRYPKFDED